MNETVFNKNLLDVWSNLEWFSEIPDQFCITGVSNLNGVHPAIGCFQFNHPFAIKNLWVGDFSYVASD